MKLPFTQGTKTTGDFRFTNALPENMIANPDPILGGSGYVTNHYGLKKIDDSDGLSRGGVYNDKIGIGFRVIGNGLFTLNPDGTILERLGDISGEGQVSMPFSFNTQAIITQQGNFYLYNQEVGLVTVNDPLISNIFDGVWIDGYYFLVDDQSPIVTDILDEQNIRQLNYGSAEIDPDDIRGCDKWRNYAVVFGSHTMEFYDNVGGEQFPFQRIESYTIYTGIVGTHAKVKLPQDAGFFVLGASRNEKPSFKIAVNNSADNMTTDEVQRIIDEYSEADLSETTLEYIRVDNQEFIYCHLPRHTLLFNLTATKAQGLTWSIVKTGKCLESWQAINPIMMPALTKYTWGSRRGNNVFQFDMESAAQNGQDQEHVIYSPMFIAKDSIAKVKPQIVNGGSELGIKDTIFLSTTQDGKSYSKEQPFRIGETYRYWNQLEFRRLGFYRNWVGFKQRYVGSANLTMTDWRVNEDV